MLKGGVPNLFVAGTLIHGLISLANIAVDYPTLSGELGLIPDGPWIRGVVQEFSTDVVLRYFPSLLYFVSPFTLLYVGIAAAIFGILTGIFSKTYGRFASFIVYLVLLSFSNSRGILLWFPWDCLLFECLLLSSIVPDSSFAKRFLLFRVMFGFGKHKFLGADSWDDLTYTQSMACWQPLGTTIGWYLSFIPSWIHVISIFFTFIAEMVSPFIILFPHRFSASTHRLACWSIIMLMAMIQFTGHFGWFNTLTSLIAICVMYSPSDSTPRHTSPVRTSFRLTYITLAIVFLIPSQWNSPAMFYQHSFDSPQWDIVRVASSWRFLHTYGVFPPKKMPMVKPVGQFQITLNDNHNIDLEYYYQSTPNSDPLAIWPLYVAPLRFPRFDYIYGFYSASHVFSLTTRLGPIIGTGEEYIDSVANMLLLRPESSSKYFKTVIPPDTKISNVKFFVLGLTPSDTGKWIVLSRELDREWTSPVPVLTEPVITDWFPPNMIVLRKQSNLFGTLEGNRSSQRLLDRAIINVEKTGYYPIGSEQRWLADIELEFERTTNTSLFSCGDESGMYDLSHSSEFGGYIACLTFAHLVPYPIHSPLCRHVLVHNYRSRQPDNRFSKIPIDDFVYTLLGMSMDDLVS